MTRYAGRYLATITQDMLDGNWRQQSTPLRFLCARVRGALGSIMPQDVGKHVFEVDGIIQVENDEQRDTRLKEEDVQ